MPGMNQRQIHNGWHCHLSKSIKTWGIFKVKTNACDRLLYKLGQLVNKYCRTHKWLWVRTSPPTEMSSYSMWAHETTLISLTSPVSGPISLTQIRVLCRLHQGHGSTSWIFLTSYFIGIIQGLVCLSIQFWRKLHLALSLPNAHSIIWQLLYV